MLVLDKVGEGLELPVKLITASPGSKGEKICNVDRFELPCSCTSVGSDPAQVRKGGGGLGGA